MHIILFDGVCNFCNASINFIIDRDSRNQFSFASLQSEIGRKLLQQYQVPDTNSLDSVVLIKNGKVYKKSAAALEIVKDLNGLWPVLSIFNLLPSFILDTFYDLLAKNRYKLFGKSETCRIPTPQLRQKFL
ncbi:DCC1-like thiol-disulfide oxidoreductase family protein [Rhodocytophaga aerolata]|uniref:DCC1-like thiol-disulfide oxidoreductase family protein n=1 Tax=Rhodocytophaga aerolata TaxID=455078 RepID=A0ABT8R6M9_9BACT|nr:DCC1-like thiol-disulfide oxidoreductase family protein [Rhodocytophaga aerolata]MDO1447756.1 DCC1-like thiol-disulfide oxidoreductase family protein [Rhodocytophaga aerolata]